MQKHRIREKDMRRIERFPKCFVKMVVVHFKSCYNRCELMECQMIKGKEKAD